MSDAKPINDGGPAFPHDPRIMRQIGHDDYQVVNEGQVGGMSLRDYFAAKAVQGLCCDFDECGSITRKGAEWIATEAYRISDAMLAERARA